MASVGGVPEFEGAWSSGRGGRREMPPSLSVALVLVHALLVATLLGGVGLLLTASSYDSLDGEVLALVAYAAAPGVLGWWLARRTWQGGVRVRRGLIGVQVWLILGALANLTAGSARGGIQLFLPVLILCFLRRPESREWYELPEPDRAERRPFSVGRMIRRRRDEGQTAVEYAGLVALVAALVTALVVSGLGTQIYGGIEAQVCKVVGMGCPAPAGSDDKDTNATGTSSTGTSSTGTNPTGTNPTGTNPNATNPNATNPNATNPNATNPNATNPTGDGKSDNGSAQKKDDGCFSGFGAFFGCAGNQVKQVGQGLFVDGVWGDVTGIYGMVRHPLNTLKGIGDYGKHLGDDWLRNSRNAGKKWSDGDYFGAVLDWGGASLKTGGTVLYDLFVGDDVAKDWKGGDKTRAVTHVLWNVGSLFIPGYDGAKVVEKVGELGKLGKLGKLGELAEKAGKAAEDARKAAKAGDVEGAEKAAKEADEAADEAERKARQSGCTISAPARRTPYGDGPRDGTPAPLTGSPGTNTTVLAAGPSAPYVLLADDGCDENAKKAAEEARKQADEAERAAAGVDLQQAADEVKKTIAEAKDKQKTPKGDRFQLDENKIDDLVAKAKDHPDLSKGEIGKEELAQSLKDLSDMLKTRSIDSQSRGSLGGPVLKAGNRHQLAEAMAEVKAARRAADEAAEGTKVYAGVGAKKGRKAVDLGDGTTADLSAIDDADVVYKGKDGNLHVVEVKNTGQAATQASIRAQARRLADWQQAYPGRRARYEIETQQGWDKVFDGFQKDKKTGEFPPGTPAETLADNGLDLRVAGQDISPRQLKAMNDAWNRKTEAEKQAARNSGKMKDPKTAMEYLGVS
ncbi:hypothetical protein [Streptomyces sp. NPDC046197]|uniref:Flp family type IVb pilin n=1 Tax=Streptomyces sp. NPDC046197 TaxID=3154337 RepID=UPI003407F289